MNWQKRARLGVAIFGIASAIGVYAVMGERATPVPAAVPQRLDPKAIIESQGNILQQVRGTSQDFKVEARQQLTYEGGAARFIDVKVTVRKRGGRDFVITAREAKAGEKQQDLHLTGDVKLVASDGFTIATPEAFFTEADGTVRAPGAFTFSRGGMEGAGAGMSYDKNNDVLSIVGAADVRLKDEGGNTLTQFSAGNAVFTRPTHVLALGGSVHVLHHEQVIDAGSGTAQLAEDDSTVRTIALRDKASVAGGGQGLESMRADTIDLDYADNGQTLERVVLAGSGSVSMAAAEGQGGRQIFGEQLDMTLAPDGALKALTGRNGVRLDLAGSKEATARSVTARSLDGTGVEGKGLTAATFRDNVEYREEARAETVARVVRARALQIALANDAVESAAFSGGVRFDEQAMQASGGEAIYAPSKGTLRLTGGAEKAIPRVADEQVTVDATTIDITLADRRMTAVGAVKTTLRPKRPAPAARGAAAARAAAPDDSKLPGLLKQEQPATVSANQFSYAGAAGKAVYTGEAALVQGETAIRANEIVIDQAKGDLVATGDARSTLLLDTGTAIGSAQIITYVDATRLITYEGKAAVVAGPGAKAVPAVLAQVSRSAQERLSAVRIEIVLAREGSKVDRLEAYQQVTMKVDKRTATGARLTFFSAEERYLMTGSSAAPVKVVADCREVTGRTLTFFKSADRIIVDGNEQIRTQTTTGGGTCSQPAPASR